MKKNLKFLIAGLIIFGSGFLYGYFVHRDRIFPSKLIRDIYMGDLFRRTSNWSIGIYRGDSPFSLKDREESGNPVLTAGDVTDAKAAFVADPFIVKENDQYYMFFEVMNMADYKGDIGYAVSRDGLEWEYRRIILDEPFHLSYPCLWKEGDDYYMIPESSEDQSVRLYRAVSFPEKWEFTGKLLSGKPFNDPTLLRHDNKYWIFVSYPGFSKLDLFYSDSLEAGWKPHPVNPLIENDRNMANPAGRVLDYDGRLFRITQDCEPYYGTQVFAVEIIEISETAYRENRDSLITVVTMGDKYWNKAGMHQADFHNTGGEWFAAVDGIRRR